MVNERACLLHQGKYVDKNNILMKIPLSLEFPGQDITAWQARKSQYFS